MNITYMPSHITDGYILKLSEGAMEYPRVERYPKNYRAHVSTRQAIMNMKQSQDYGDTPGVQYNLPYR